MKQHCEKTPTDTLSVVALAWVECLTGVSVSLYTLQIVADTFSIIRLSADRIALSHIFNPWIYCVYVFVVIHKP